MPVPQDALAFTTDGQLPELAPDHVLLFSGGIISRTLAIRALGIGYSELLEQIATRNLPLPRVSEAEADRMAATLMTFLETAAG